ncbi:MAG: hypothetical protein ACR2RF_10420 [Geminicoccaceae bacterium]
MALLYVAEFTNLNYGGRGNVIMAPKAPPLVVQTPVDFTSGEAKSAIFNDQTRYVLITCDANCHWQFGEDPTATTDDMPLWKNLYAGFTVERAATMRVSVIAGV